VSEPGGFRGLLFFIFLTWCGDCLAAPATSKGGFVAKVLFSESSDSLVIGPKGPRPLRPGAFLFTGERIHSRSGSLKIRMREGNNEIFMAEHSQLRIDKASSTGRLNGAQFSLNEGAARFVVNAQYSGRGSDRFRVKTPTALVEVLGTVFVVSYDSNAQITTTATLEGSTLTKSLKSSLNKRIVPVGFCTSISAAGVVSEPISILKSETAKVVVIKLAEGANYNLSQVRAAKLESSRTQALRDHLENNQNRDWSHGDASSSQSQSIDRTKLGRKSKEKGSDAIEKLLIKALGI
jgi:hypothetical protein